MLNINKKVAWTLAILLVSNINASSATVYLLPLDNSRLIGNNTTHTVIHDGGSLEAIADKYKIGLLAMLEANPSTDLWLPRPGTVLTIPSQMLLPDTLRKGIIINLAELRLYYYPKGGGTVIVYPIGIGQLGRNTPIMLTSISQKIINPTWTPTANIRKIYLKEQGIILPAVVPAGRKNPMGLYALRLAAGNGTYLIHGTNANFGIGMRVSSGCIRLRPDDIEALFNSVSVGTRVQVINEPIKVAEGPYGKRYLEVHQPLSHSEKDDPKKLPISFNASIAKFVAHPATDLTVVKQVVERRSGMPVLVNADQLTIS